MAQKYGLPEGGQLPRTWTRGRRERQKTAKGRTTQRVRNWTVQNEMKGVLGRVSASATQRILDSANPREIGLNRRLCPLQRRRERTQRE